MTAAQQKTTGRYIHYNPEQIDYAVSDHELQRLSEAGSNLWKDVCLVSATLGISCIINAVANTPKPFDLTLGLFLNYLFGICGIACAVVLGIAWYRRRTTFRSIINTIKNKPKMQLTLPETTDVGELPSASLSSVESEDAG